MRRRYESSSQASSLFSAPQPTTRASSRTAVASPIEDNFSLDRYGRNNSSKVSKFRENILEVQELETHIIPEPEPYDSYLSRPSESISDPPSLVRQRTTKELIGRYESLDRSVKSQGEPSGFEFPKRSSGAVTDNEKKGKGRSPIRQSFRNLLSVFSKKGLGRLGKDNSSLCVPEERSDVALEVKKPSPLHINTAPTTPLTVETTPEVTCMTPLDLHSGELLHLCHPETSDSLPVWTACDVALHPSHILITWRTNHGNPSTSIITFDRCTDVRSLGLRDLSPDERGLLPSDPNGGEFQPFELLFEGRERQRFAATSVKERAGWVGAIW